MYLKCRLKNDGHFVHGRWVKCRFHLPSSLYYKTHLSRQWNSRSLRCSWSIGCRRCSNYIFILDLTPGFTGLGEDNCTTRETSKFGDLVRLILEIYGYIHMTHAWSSLCVSTQYWYDHKDMIWSEIPWISIISHQFSLNRRHYSRWSSKSGDIPSVRARSSSNFRLPEYRHFCAEGYDLLSCDAINSSEQFTVLTMSNHPARWRRWSLNMLNSMRIMVPWWIAVNSVP